MSENDTYTDETDRTTASLSLEDLHGTRLVWEDSDGNTHKSEPFTCNDDSCEICVNYD